MKRCSCGTVLQVVLPDQFGSNDWLTSSDAGREQSADHAATGSDFLAVHLGLDKPEHDVYLNGELTRGKCRGK